MPTKHGDYGSKEYKIWASMINRCYNSNDKKSYLKYGGKGIRVCQRWRDSYAAFLEDMGRCPEGCSLDRENGKEGYNKSNCRWATIYEQANNRTITRFVLYNGKQIALADLSRQFNTPRVRLRYLIVEKGYSMEEIIEKDLINIRYRREPKPSILT